MNLIYIKRNTPLPQFIPLPRFILKRELTLNAKLLYGLLLNRTTLSKKNGWEDENGNVFVIYTIRQMAEDLDCSERTVKTVLSALECDGLIRRVRRGWNQANRIFVLIPDGVKLIASAEGKNVCTEGKQHAFPMVQDLPPSNTEQRDTEEKRGEGEGIYGNVVLSAQQLETLHRDFPGRSESYIQRLSVYMEQSGRSYANHDATIRKWIAEDRSRSGVQSYDYEHIYEEGDCL